MDKCLKMAYFWCLQNVTGFWPWSIERATVVQTNHNYQLPTHAPIVHIVPMDCSMVKTYGQTNTNRYHADQVSLVSVHAIYKPRPRHIKSSGPWYTNWTNIKPTIDQRSDPYRIFSIFVLGRSFWNTFYSYSYSYSWWYAYRTVFQRELPQS